jgi:hypothetical protein
MSFELKVKNLSGAKVGVLSKKGENTEGVFLN